MKHGIKYRRILPCLFCLFVFSCKRDGNTYLYNDMAELKNEQKMLTAFSAETKNSKARFAMRDKIAKNLKIKKKNKSLLVYLSSLAESTEKDDYKEYWFLMLANEYMEQNMTEPAAYYFERIVNSEKDIEINGKSAKLISLKNLISITNEPKRLAEYYSKLITDFYDSIDPAYSYFMLAQNYEKLGEWHLAIQTYSKFISLRRFDLIIPGIPDNYGYARKIVDYSSSSKSWTVENLDDLVARIKTAISQNDYVTLEHYRSKVNFFTMAWKQELSELYSQPDFDLKNFMYGSHITMAAELDPSSTPREAYLKTSGWNQYVSTWYLYFKKVNFPADPDIHGKWEWAGIYYGEKI